MNATIKDTKEFYSFISLLQCFEDNVRFDCGPEGIKIMCLANANTCIIKCMLTNNFFEDYVCEKPLLLGLNVKVLGTILKKAKKEDSLSLKGTEEILTLSLMDGSNMTSYDLKLIDIEIDALEIPEVDYNFSCMLTPSVLKIWQTMVLDITKGDFAFQAVQDENDTLIIESEGDMQKVKRLEKLNFNICKEPMKFSLAQKSMVIITGLHQFNKELCMCFQNNMPIEVSFDLNDECSIECWFAPQISDDDDVDMDA